MWSVVARRLAAPSKPWLMSSTPSAPQLLDQATGARIATVEELRALCEQAQCGVRNLYDNPAQLGADRWAALIGARTLHAGACLVVCAGTATTVDVLDDEGNFQGGLILPGVALMVRALAGNTAQLPLAEGKFAGLPRNTADAIVSGCLHAQAGAIERMFEQVVAYAEATCLVGGGAAAQLCDLLRIPTRQVDTLVLEGLARIGRE